MIGGLVSLVIFFTLGATVVIFVVGGCAILLLGKERFIHCLYVAGVVLILLLLSVYTLLLLMAGYYGYY